MAQTLLWLIIAFVTLEFIISSVLSWLNTKWMTHPVPPELEGLYDEEKYRKQQDYMRTNKRVSLVARCLSFALTLVILGCGLLGWLDNLCKSWTDLPVLQVVLFLLIYNLFNTIIALPFSYYSTFVIEERFGFNRTTHKTFWLDTLKSFLVSTVISAVLLGVVYWLYQTFGQEFWIWATLVCAVFIIFFSLFYSNLIVPLFNKQTPLPEGELRDAITTALASFGSKFKDIYIINGSKHSTKANAYFTGFGPKKRIVLYDTLQDQMTNDEIVAVLAHEFGHYKNRDTFKNMIISIVTIAVNLFIFSLLVGNPDLPAALGGTAPSFILALVAFSLLLSPIDIVLSPLGSAISRRAEYRADAFAASHGHGEALISGLKKLAAHALSNLTPHPLVVWYSYSHPTLAQRIRAIRSSTNNPD
jgi:STE24 endopeptidase